MALTRLWRPFEVKAISDEGEISGYGSVFGVEDHYGDTVIPGAFKASLAKRLPLMLWQHDTERPIGVWTKAAEDEHGLYLEGRIVTKSRDGADAHELLKAKAVTGLSIGFRTIKDEYDRETDKRKLLQVDLWEVSPVSFPANEAARIEAVKARSGKPPDITDIERALRDAGLSRTEAKAVLATGFGALRDAAPATLRDAGGTDPQPSAAEFLKHYRAGAQR